MLFRSYCASPLNYFASSYQNNSVKLVQTIRVESSGDTTLCVARSRRSAHRLRQSGLLAKSNAAQVTRVRGLIEGLSIEVATPDEAHQMLSLKGRGSANF